MITTPPTAQTLRELALRSFLASLGEAKKAVDNNQQVVLSKEKELREAIQQFTEAQSIVTAYEALIEQHSSEPNNGHVLNGQIVESKTNALNFDTNESEDSAVAEDVLEPKRKRERLNAAPKLLELITNGGIFKTAEQLIEMLEREYGDRIKEKTSKNVIWSLNSDNSIRKYYSKEQIAYIYGLPEWFLGDKPSPQHLPQHANPFANLATLIPTDVDDDDEPFE